MLSICPVCIDRGQARSLRRSPLLAPPLGSACHVWYRRVEEVKDYNIYEVEAHIDTYRATASENARFEHGVETPKIGAT